MRSENSINKLVDRLKVIFEQTFQEYENLKNEKINNFNIKENKKIFLKSGYKCLYELFLLETFHNNNLIKAKHYCFNLAKSIEAYYHSNGHLENGIQVVIIEHYYSNTLALLSDKIDLVRKFQHYDYSMRNKYGDNKEENRQYFIEKQGFMWGYAMQCIINEDFVALNRIIDAAKELHKKTANKSRHYDVHWAVWEAIRDRDLEGIERTIHALIKNSRTFNDNIWGEYISLPATGYLKAAWIIGLEVEIKHKLIPMEMMPVRPLKVYRNDFDFFLPNNPELSSLIGSLLNRH